MRRLVALTALTVEFVRYLFASSPEGAKEPFRDRLLADLIDARIRNGWRPYAATYVIVSALNSGAYDTLFRLIKSVGRDIEWEHMSPELLRKIFEVAIIDDELSIANRALAEISTKSLARGANLQIKPLRCLIDWRAGRIEDESAIDLDLKYFVVFPAYDEYFKGRIFSSTGRLSEAKVHFQRCLELAPENAQELREDVLRRM
jgi:hypothetical protein